MWTLFTIIVVGGVIAAVLDHANSISIRTMGWKMVVRDLMLMFWGCAIGVQVYVMTH